MLPVVWSYRDAMKLQIALEFVLMLAFTTLFMMIHSSSEPQNSHSASRPLHSHIVSMWPIGSGSWPWSCVVGCPCLVTFLMQRSEAGLRESCSLLCLSAGHSCSLFSPSLNTDRPTYHVHVWDDSPCCHLVTQWTCWWTLTLVPLIIACSFMPWVQQMQRHTFNIGIMAGIGCYSDGGLLNIKFFCLLCLWFRLVLHSQLEAVSIWDLGYIVCLSCN